MECKFGVISSDPFLFGEEKNMWAILIKMLRTRLVRCNRSCNVIAEGKKIAIKTSIGLEIK
jgi:hypothetical protein